MMTVELVGGPRCGEIHNVPNVPAADAWLLISDVTRGVTSEITDAPAEGAQYKLRIEAHPGHSLAYGRPSITREGIYRADFAGWHK